MLEFCPIPEQFPNWRLKYFEDPFFLDLSLTCQLPQDILKEFFVHWTLLCRCRMLLTVCRRVQRSLQPGRLWFTLSNLSTFRPTARRIFRRTECKWNPVDPGVDPRGNRYPEIHTLWQRLAFGSVWHACCQDLEKVAISKQRTGKAGMAKCFSFRKNADAKLTGERFSLP